MARVLQVEWFNVTYRSVVMWVLLLVLAGGGAGGWWFYTQRLGPMREATQAIVRADERLAETAGLLDQGPIAVLVGNARSSLEQARNQFDGGAYTDAQISAMRSENSSRQALQLANPEPDKPHTVQIQDVDGDVRVKKAGEFSWISAETGLVLNIGDQVKTSSRGKARLLYFDGTETSVEPGSLLEIRDLYEDPVTKVRRVREKLTWGEVQASTRKRNVSGSFHEVTTDKAAARTEDGGEFRVVYDQQRGTSTVDVFDGRVEVATASRKETVEAGERIRAASDGTLSAKQDLPPMPRLVAPSDQRVFVFEDPAKSSVTLSWEPVPGAASYRLEIADRPLFAETRYAGERPEPRAVIEGIVPGTYHWRVAAVSASGAPGGFSGARAFRVSAERIRDRSDTVPPRLEISEFVTVGQMVVINGETEPGAALWVDSNKVDVYSDGSFNAVVRLRREGKNEVVLVAQDNAGNEARLARTAFVELY